MQKKWEERTFHINNKDTRPGVFNYQYAQEEILEAIEQKDSQALEDILTDKFLYQQGQKTRVQPYIGSNSSSSWHNRYYLVRSVPEALLYDCTRTFHRILGVLQNQEKQQQTEQQQQQISILQTFIESCLEASPKLFGHAFSPLDKKQLAAIQQEIQQLEQAYPEHHAAKRLADELKAWFDEKNLPALEDKLAQLVFKLNVIEILHTQDQAFARDTNYACIMGNIAMILLGFIPNLINWMCTGNFLFFKDTPQQASVKRIDAHFSILQPPQESSEPECPEDNEFRYSPSPPSLSKYRG